MSHILCMLAANYDQKHLENSKIKLENYWIFCSKRVGTLSAHQKLTGTQLAA